MHYHFCRIHQSLHVMSTMEAEIAERIWEVENIVKLVERSTPKPNPPKKHGKHQIPNLATAR